MVKESHHRLPGSFLVMEHTSQIKKSLFPLGEQGQKINSAVPPCLQEYSCRSARCQHTGCPLTLAMRQTILRLAPVLSALGGPFADPLFAPLSALRHSLWMRCQLYFRVCGLTYDMLFIQQKCPFVKHEIIRQADKRGDDNRNSKL